MNKNLCEISLTINDEEYAMVYTIGALGEYETAFENRPLFDLNAAELLQAALIGLRKKHPEITLNFLENSDLYKELLQKKILEATLIASFGLIDGRKRFEYLLEAVDDLVDFSQEDNSKKK